MKKRGTSIFNKTNQYLKEERFSSWIICYLVIWAVTSFFVFLPFLIEGKSFIWKQDGMYTYFPTLAYGGRYIREWIKEVLSGNFSMDVFQFNYGMGMDVYPMIISMFTDPVKLLAVITPIKYTEQIYNVIVLINYFLIGASFLVYCRYMKRDRFSSLIGAMVYCFSGYALYAGVRHPQFLTPMYVLPILLIGAEKLLKKERKYVFVLALAFSMANSYYFTFMHTICLVLYIAIRYFDLTKKPSFKEVLLVIKDFSLYYLLGIGMAAFAYAPQIVDFFQSTRTENVISTNSMALYSSEYYKTFFASFIAPAKNPGYWVVLNFTAISLLAIVYIFMQRKKNYRSFQIGIAVMTTMLMFPFVGYVFSGFNSVSNRWCFSYAFVVAFALCYTVMKLKEMTKRELGIMLGFVMIFAFATFKIDIANTVYSICGLAMLCLSFVLLMAFQQNQILQSKYYKPVIFLLVFGSILLQSKYLYNEASYSNQFVERGEAMAQLKKTPLNAMDRVDDDSFYRAEQTGGGPSTGNAALVLRYNGLTQFNNVNKAWYLEYLAGLENAGVKDIVVAYNFDGRAMMNALASVKYFGCNKDETAYVPFGYELVAESKKAYIYENKYSLPIGYTYDSYLLEDEYASLTALQKQEAMLQAVVLEEATEVVEEKDTADLIFESSEIKDVSIKYKNIVDKGDRLVVKKDKASITLSFEGKKNTETYVQLLNLVSTDPDFSGKITVSTKGVSKTRVIQGTNHLYKTSYDNYLFQMGYHETAITSCTIEFSKAGEYTWDGVKVYSQKMDNYVEQVENRKEDTLENVVIADDTVTGEITLSKDKILTMSIPYSTGWTAYVNNEKVDILRANGMYMAVELRSGYNQVEFVFQTPGVFLGFCVTVLAMIIAGICLLYIKRKNR